LTAPRRAEDNRSDREKEVEMVDRSWAADSLRWQRFAHASGIAFVVTALVAFLIAGAPETGATGEEVVSHFRENENAYKWQALLYGLAAAFFVWFFGTVAARIRRAENDPAGRLPAIVVLASATTGALYVVGVAAWTSLAKTAQEEGATRALFDLGDQAFALANFTAAALAFAVALAVLRTMLLDEWVAWGGIALAAILVVTGVVQVFSDGDAATVLGYIAFLAFLAWALALSALLTWERTSERPARPATMP
jgi:hypothetical protein